MSLLIKGADMPKDYQQHDINLFNTADGFWAEEYRFKNSESKYKTRLLHSVVKIPTPHGDLIDRDDLLAYFGRKAKEKTAEEALKLLYTALKAYPTVIEAEGKS